MKRKCRWAFAVASALLVLPASVFANVYPTNLTQSSSSLNTYFAQTVNLGYLLNQAADAGVTVDILNSSNAVVKTFALGAQSQGVQTLSWDGTDSSNNPVPAGDYSFRVTTSALGCGGWTQISNDGNVNLQFNSPRGVSVNRDPTSPYYGRIFVANSAAGAQGDGIFARNADGSDSALGQGNSALTGGFSWGASTSASPYFIEVGSDNKLYISDGSDPHGGIYRTDMNISNGEQVLDGIGDSANPSVHGSTASSVIVSGSTAGGDLKVFALDEDMIPHQGLWEWNIGAGPLPSAVAPTLLSSPLISFVAGTTVDLARGPAGNFYLSQNRSAGAEAGLFVTDNTGVNVLWDSLNATRTLLGNPSAPDMLTKVRAIAVSSDGNMLVAVVDNSSFWTIPLVGGVPDLSLAALQSVGSVNFGRDISMDAVGNVYVSSSGNAKVKIYSPGGANSSFTESLAPLGAIHVVPEPGSLLALGAGVVSLAGILRRKRA
ncbi:MAG: PEP-CTERM sorting domain-containing protein [Armatimonadetes bacterium]|nr:PEP-CTERM sorting domain-containing protein [Armatimonadota bacterium]